MRSIEIYCHKLLGARDRHGIEAHFVSANEITGRLDKPVVVIADTFNKWYLSLKGIP